MNRAAFVRSIPGSRAPLAAACALALAAAGCGGGSGGGSGNGNGDAELSNEEQAALAAMAGSSVAGVGRSQGDQAGHDTDDDPDGATATIVWSDDDDDSIVPICQNDGELRIWDDVEADFPETDVHHDGAPVADEEDLADLLEERAGGVFEGEPDNGVFENHQQRADNCVFTDDIVMEGAVDAVQYENVGNVDDARVFYTVIGNRTGDVDDETTPPDPAGEFETGQGATSGWAVGCEGCLEGDDARSLEDFSVDGRNEVFVARLSVDIDTEEHKLSWRLGEDDDRPFTLKATAQPNNLEETAVELDGRLGHDEEGQACTFDVVYETHEPLIITEYENLDEPGEVRDGELTITVDGEPFAVEVVGPGEVEVDGEPISEDDLAGVC